MAKRKPSTNVAGEVRKLRRGDVPRASAARGELDRPAEPVPGSDAPRLKMNEYGYLEIAETGDRLTSEIVKELSEDAHRIEDDATYRQIILLHRRSQRKDV